MKIEVADAKLGTEAPEQPLRRMDLHNTNMLRLSQYNTMELSRPLH